MTASTDQAKAIGMRLATWNLWWRFGPWSERQEAIKSVLSELDADIIALQEVWVTDETNQAELLASELGYYFKFVPSPTPEKWQRRINDDTIGIGNAVVSRWPIVSTKTRRLPAGDAIDEGRVAIHTMIDSPHGLVPFTTTHLNSAWGHNHIRTEQLRTVCELIAAQPTGAFPPMLCGDFNAMDDYDEIRALAGKTQLLVSDLVLLDSWRYVDDSSNGYTWDRENPYVGQTHEPSGRIDYIFIGLAHPDGAGMPIATGLFGTSAVAGIWPSDHFGVWTDVVVPDS